MPLSHSARESVTRSLYDASSTARSPISFLLGRQSDLRDECGLRDLDMCSCGASKVRYKQRAEPLQDSHRAGSIRNYPHFSSASNIFDYNNNIQLKL